MSDQSQGPGWWLASDGKWYPPQPPQFVQPAKQGPNGCAVAAAVVSALVIVGMIVAVVLVEQFGDEIDDATSVAGRDNGVEITLSEFDRIEVGMSLAEVERIVGGEGALMSSAGSGESSAAIYSWDGSGSFGANAHVTFQGGQVTGKAQIGLG